MADNSKMLVSFNSTDLAKTSYGSEILEKIDANIKLLNGIKIVDTISATQFHSGIKVMKSILKMVDERAKELKAPYKEAISNIDLVKDEFKERIEKCIDEGKLRLKAFDDAEEEKRKKLEEEAKAKAEEERKKAEQELEKKNKLIQKLSKYSTIAINAMNECVDMTQLKEAYATYVNPGFPKEMFDDIPEERAEIYVKLVEFKDTCKNKIQQLSKAKSKKDRLNILTQTELAKEATEEALDAKIEEAKQEAAEETEGKVISSMVIAQGYSGPSKNILGKRKTWTYEVVDIKKVKLKFLEINNSAVRDFIATEKENWTPSEEGFIIDGIRYYQKESTTL